MAKRLQCRQKALLKPASDELSVRNIGGKYNSQILQDNLFFVFFNSKSYFSSVAHLMVYIFEYLLKAVLGLVPNSIAVEVQMQQ